MEALSREQQLEEAEGAEPAMSRTTSGEAEPLGPGSCSLLAYSLSAADLLALYQRRRGAPAPRTLSADASSRGRSVPPEPVGLFGLRELQRRSSALQRCRQEVQVDGAAAPLQVSWVGGAAVGVFVGADVRASRQELREEKALRDALRRRSCVPYFHLENLPLYQVGPPPPPPPL